ncbi:MAG: hypothetical protein AB1941_18700 [Gemmatimonadota bacterium]
MASERSGERTGGPADNDRSMVGTGDEPTEEVLRETREAGMRAEGGGSSDEDAIRRAAQDGEGGS